MPAVKSASGPVLPMAPCRQRGQQHWDVLVVGDEPAGVMTALELADQLPRLTGRPNPRIALVTEADTRLGLGGVITRSGLAYLDRNQVPRDMWDVLSPFAPSSRLYERFLRITDVNHIAVDRRRASAALTKALRQARIPVLSQADLVGVGRQGRRLCVLQSRRYGSLGADLVIDASLGARVAHLAGVPFQGGFGPRELAHQSLALGWIFEVQGLSLQQLRALEEVFSQRLLDPKDQEAQAWLKLWPRYRRHPKQLLTDLLDENGNPQLAFSNTSDSADQRSPAMAIAFHGESGLGTDWRQTPVRLDQANIALLPGSLSFNALLLRNDAVQNRQVLAGQNRPLPWMYPYADKVTAFFMRHGAKRVEWMPELYVRSADQLANPVAVLGESEMANGGVPHNQALGTFSYFLDFRGGIKGIAGFPKPTFNFGYRHTLPRETDNLAVLGPAAGYGVGQVASSSSTSRLARDWRLPRLWPWPMAWPWRRSIRCEWPNSCLPASLPTAGPPMPPACTWQLHGSAICSMASGAVKTIATGRCSGWETQRRSAAPSYKQRCLRSGIGSTLPGRSCTNSIGKERGDALVIAYSI
jgi:hypothetical protein